MKRILMTSITIFILACTGDDTRFEYYQPANPPIAVEMKKILSGEFTGDYLLVFRAENRGNTRFNGFLIFINPIPDEIDYIQNIDYEDFNLESSKAFTEYIKGSADYILGYLSVDEALNGETDTNNYNPTLGIDTEIIILFSDNENYTPGETVVIEDESYTVTARRYRDKIVPGSDIIFMAYLLQDWEDIDSSRLIAGVSNPSEPVKIE